MPVDGVIDDRFLRHLFFKSTNNGHLNSLIVLHLVFEMISPRTHVYFEIFTFAAGF